MTPEQITLVQLSFDRLGPRLPAMTTHFYQAMFEKDPALRRRFSADMAEQKIRFAEKLTEIVRAISELDVFLAHTRDLGARHIGYGVRAHDYGVVGEALVEALAAVLGSDFDSPTREAWALAYNLVAETMLEGAAAARPLGR
jgi:hemoglobin-like flavoprotein